MCPRGGPDGTPKCIAKTQLCDGKRDCEDNSDEETACCKYFSINQLAASIRCQWRII